jgi:demethylmacrocin O-methyltransferase
MLLSELYKTNTTRYISDKFSETHDYIPAVYDRYFLDIKETAKTILEVGIKGGASLILWRDYFTNARVIGLDINSCKQFDKPENQYKDIFCIIGDAYSQQVLDMIPYDIDVAIDDGSHMIEDILFFIDNYLPRVKSGGYLIVEDILPEYIDILHEKVKDLDYYMYENNATREDNNLLVITKA